MRALLAGLALLWAAAAHGAAPPPMPCVDADASREFDFWVGTWVVHTGDGQLAGHNRIKRAEGACRIDEAWRGVSGGTGSSINFHDPVDDVWEQVWHSPGGVFIRIRGGLEGDGDMRMAGTIHYLARDLSAPFRARWTRLADGRVRQFFEQFDSDADAWMPWFEGFYTRIDESRMP